MSMKVEKLFVYPIKSLQGISLNKVNCLNRGFEYDRRWMLIDDENKFITQRTKPEMALFQQGLDRFLRVSHREKDKIGVEIPFNAPNDSPLIKVTVWKSIVDAVEVNPKTSQWFSEMLGFSCRLVYMPDSSNRKVEVPFSSDKIVSFADAYPYLICSVASLQDLNNKLEDQISIERFRCNILLSGTTAFEEDQWATIKIGNATFDLVKSCARCVLINVNPQTGIPNKEPLKTLSTFRTQGNKVMFGQNAFVNPVDTNSTIRVGDQISIVSKK